MIFKNKIEKIYRARLFSRCDDSGLVNYFSASDFAGLTAEPYCFKSSLGHTLRGFFYSYDNADKSKLIIFEHGLGGGHRSYMKEIEKLCRDGYLVYSYDHTGCMESDGDGTNGLAQSLSDLDDCLKTLKSDPAVNTSCIYVIGHSWGGFSTLNIAELHPDVKKIVAISGFIAPEKMIEQIFSGLLKPYRKHVLALERAVNPEYADVNAVDTLKSHDLPALLIYSDNDPTVKRELSYDILNSELGRRKNTTLLLERGKGHNPNYSVNAVSLLAKLGKAMKKVSDIKTDDDKRKFRGSFDWHAMTEQDEKVWRVILDFLRR